MLAPRPRPLQLLSWVTLFILLVIVYRSPQYVKHPEDLPRPSRPPPQDPQPGNQKPLKPYKPPVISEETLRKVEAPTNSTLGFGAIVVVSKADSSRRDSLLQAANVTELDFVIPDQPKWTDQDVKKFQNGPDTKIGHGSVMAWLGHNHALQWFLDSGLETALFLEDDVDWDIHLRTLQVPLAAGAARQLLGKSSADANNDGEYWGSTDAWDLLYIGHCGDYFGPVPPKKGPPIQVPSNLTSIPHTTFADPSMPNREDLHPFTADMLSNLKLAEHTRAIHRSRFPLCTFAYAVTRDAARRLVTELAPPREAAPDAVEHPRAFDVAVLHACRNGYDPETKKDRPEGLKCYSVNPELFHHMPGSSTIADVEKSRGNKVGLPPVDAKGAKQVEYRDETSNIGCGFFSGDFRFWDLDRLAWLRENVGRKGQCLKNGQNIQHP